MLRTLLAGMLALSVCCSAQCSAETTFTADFTDTGEALVNPGMGWCLYFYSNVPENYGSKLEASDTMEDFPGLSTVYLRVPWCFLEPEEGQFNWALLDTPAQRWISRGKRIAIRVTCSENWIERAVPEWVEKAGAKGTRYKFGDGPQANPLPWDPVFDDPVFLEKLENFLKAMAQRYDGNPNVEFIDVGSYGLWGEGHTLSSSRLSPEQSDPIIRKHIDMHVALFQKTQLAISDDIVGHNLRGDKFPLSDYALSKNVAIRDDSIMVQPPPDSWYHDGIARSFARRLPVILEHEHYGSSQVRKAWGDGSLLLKAVEDHRASFLSIHWWPREHLLANRPIIDRINQRLGYRLQLRSISLPTTTTIGKPLSVSSTWANAGVAPCYGGGHMALTLKDDKDGIVSVLVDEELNMRDLPTSGPLEAPAITKVSRFSIGRIAPVTRPAVYDVYISVGQRDGTPEIALPLPINDGQKRYRVGRLNLVPSD